MIIHTCHTESSNTAPQRGIHKPKPKNLDNLLNFELHKQQTPPPKTIPQKHTKPYEQKTNNTLGIQDKRKAYTTRILNTLNETYLEADDPAE